MNKDKNVNNPKESGASPQFIREKKLELMRSLMWDYNIPPEHCLEVLEGKRKNAGHYDEDTLFRKLIESFRWFTVLKILPNERIYQLIMQTDLEKLRFKTLSNHYYFLRDELSRTLHPSE